MTSLDTGMARVGGARRRSSVATSRQSALNLVMALALLAVVAILPIPLGSNRPLLWAFSATAIGFVGLVYLAVLAMLREPLRFGLERFALPGGLMAVFLAYLAVQLLPVGTFEAVSVEGAIFSGATLSLVPGTTLMTLLAFVAYTLMFFFIAQVGANDDRRELLFNVVLVIIVGYAIQGLVSLQMGDTILGLAKWSYFGVATGTFVNRNSFATFLGFGLVLSVAQLGYTLVRRGERSIDDGHVPNSTSALFAYGSAIIVLLTALLATQSRMGLFASAIGVAVAGLLLLRWMPRFRAVFGGIIAGTLATGVLVWVYGQGVMDRLGSLDNDREVRGELYAQVIDLIAQRPLTGFGAGSFNTAFPLVHRPPVSPDLVWDKAHNSYLALWAENGLIFGSLPIVILALLGVGFAHRALTSRTMLLPATIGVATISLAAVHSLVDFSLEIHAVAMMFVAILGLAAAGTMRTKQVG